MEPARTLRIATLASLLLLADPYTLQGDFGHLFFALVAQLVERLTCNEDVACSNHVGGFARIL